MTRAFVTLRGFALCAAGIHAVAVADSKLHLWTGLRWTIDLPLHRFDALVS